MRGKSALKIPRGLMLLAGGASYCLLVVSSKIRLLWGGREQKSLILHGTLYNSHFTHEDTEAHNCTSSKKQKR